MWFDQFFDKTFVIALPERRAHIEEVMQKLELEPTYFEATMALTLSRSELQRKGLVAAGCRLALPQIACALSHNAVLQTFLDSPLSTAFVFEDDITPLSLPLLAEAREAVFDTMDNVPPDWDIVNFGRCWDDCQAGRFSSAVPAGGHGGVLKSYKALCRHAYAVTRRGARKLIDCTTPLDGRMQSDELIAEQAQLGRLNMYVPPRAVFWQDRDVLGSTLGNNFKQQECARVPPGGAFFVPGL